MKCPNCDSNDVSGATYCEGGFTIEHTCHNCGKTESIYLGQHDSYETKRKKLKELDDKWSPGHD
jgi:hypothetical protein